MSESIDLGKIWGELQEAVVANYAGLHDDNTRAKIGFISGRGPEENRLYTLPEVNAALLMLDQMIKHLNPKSSDPGAPAGISSYSQGYSNLRRSFDEARLALEAAVSRPIVTTEAATSTAELVA